jgi:hypothetical protein
MQKNTDIPYIPNYVDMIKMEKDITFTCLVIKPGKISTDWHDTKYAYKLVENNNIFETVETNSDNFIKVLATKLDVDRYKIPNMNILTEIIGEEKGPNDSSYVYDLLYIDMMNSPEYKTDDNINEMASLVNVNEDKIYSNAILFRTKVESHNDSMNLSNTTRDDLARLLHHRVHTKIVIWDDTWQEQTVVGDLTKFASEFFDDGSIVKIEFPFLMHNINIWFTTFNYGSDPCGKLVNKKIDKCIWFTMKSEEYRGNLTLSEVKKIIFLSEKLSSYNTPEQYMEEKIDSMGRKIIYNKYKVLDLVYTMNL